MIEHFEAENCGCLKSVACDLTPSYAFIGPNDSGEATLLRAICESVSVVAGTPYAVGPQDVPTVLRIRAGRLSFDLSEHNSVISDGLTTERLPDRSVLHRKHCRTAITSPVWAALLKKLQGGRGSLDSMEKHSARRVG